MTSGAISKILFAVGYPTAIVCIARLRSIFRHRRTRWLVVHEAGTAAIVAGWVIEGNGPAIAFNGLWLTGVAVAWVVTGSRRRTA